MSEVISDKDYIRRFQEQGLNAEKEEKEILVLRSNVSESIKALMKPFIDLRKREETQEQSRAYEMGVQDTIGVLKSMFSTNDKRKLLIYQKRIGQPQRVRFEKLSDVIKEIREDLKDDQNKNQRNH
mgnify:CR=1 FL=1